MSPKTLKRISIIAAGAVVLAAVLIMVRGLGLAPDYDFGAGAYYYADIPDFEGIYEYDADLNDYCIIVGEDEDLGSGFEGVELPIYFYRFL